MKLYNPKDRAFCRGHVVEILQRVAYGANQSDGARYLVRFPDGVTAGVRQADLGDIPADFVSKGLKPSSSIPAAFVGLKQKIARFDPKDYKGWVEIMQQTYSLRAVDLNQLAQDLNVTGSTIYNWTQGVLRPSPSKMAEAVKVINQGIGAAIIREQEYERERRQEQINSEGPSAAAQLPKTIGDSQVAIQILEIGGQSFTVEVRQTADGLEATCPQRPGVLAKSENRVDLMIDIKSMLLADVPPSPTPPPPEPPRDKPSTDFSDEKTSILKRLEALAKRAER